MIRRFDPVGQNEDENYDARYYNLSESDVGDWVAYVDHRAEIERLTRERDAMRAVVEEARAWDYAADRYEESDENGTVPDDGRLEDACCETARALHLALAALDAGSKPEVDKGAEHARASVAVDQILRWRSVYDQFGNGKGMVVDPDGNFVRWGDHARIAAERNARIAELKQRLSIVEGLRKSANLRAELKRKYCETCDALKADLARAREALRECRAECACECAPKGQECNTCKLALAALGEGEKGGET
jgi:hypothetical protein